MTKATFSLDIPSKAIKILTYKNDIVLDPFAGSGTSLVAAQILDRRWIGIELSSNYCQVAQTRVNYFTKLEEIKESLQEEKLPSADSNITAQSVPPENDFDISKHSYLHKPFAHFKNLKPMLIF